MSESSGLKLTPLGSPHPPSVILSGSEGSLAEESIDPSLPLRASHECNEGMRVLLQSTAIGLASPYKGRHAHSQTLAFNLQCVNKVRAKRLVRLRVVFFNAASVA